MGAFFALLRRTLLDNGCSETAEDAVTLSSRPLLHKDPVDRMLVARAISELATLAAAEPVVARDSGPIRPV
jgi:PIN domain nuclease of toxin-antitoxin system